MRLFFRKEFARFERIEDKLIQLLKTFRSTNKFEDKVNRLEHQIRGAETERNRLAARITALEHQQNLRREEKMGDRGQVLMVDEKVYLYTHWNATELVETVRRALARKQRWDDPEYLARIIFCEMVKDDVKGETGFGIGTEGHGDIWRQISIDCESQKVFIKNQGEIVKTFTFEKFVQGGEKN